jgi:uncharacterized iron-regulated membrane protein
MSSDMMRLLVQQVAAVAAIFGGTSRRLLAAVRFLQTLTTPEIWSQVWQIVYPDTPAGQAASRAVWSQGGYNTDPFQFVDDLADRKAAKPPESVPAPNGPSASAPEAK